MSDTEIFRRGLEHFNRREFFVAHEVWEEIWLKAAEPEKTFLQGLIQIAAGFHHYQRGNLAGAQSLTRAGLEKLERHSQQHPELDIGRLLSSVRRWQTLIASANAPEPEFPLLLDRHF